MDSTMDAAETPLAWYYDWTGELTDDGAGGLCLLCPDCGNDRELAGQAQYAAPYDEALAACDDCDA